MYATPQHEHSGECVSYIRKYRGLLPYPLARYHPSRLFGVFERSTHRSFIRVMNFFLEAGQTQEGA